jgi:hypothetical protein
MSNKIFLILLIFKVFFKFPSGSQKSHWNFNGQGADMMEYFENGFLFFIHPYGSNKK